MPRDTEEEEGDLVEGLHDEDMNEAIPDEIQDEPAPPPLRRAAAPAPALRPAAPWPVARRVEEEDEEPYPRRGRLPAAKKVEASQPAVRPNPPTCSFVPMSKPRGERQLVLAQDPLDTARIRRTEIETYAVLMRRYRAQIATEVASVDLELEKIQASLDMLDERIEAMAGPRKPIKEAQLRALRSSEE